MKQSLTNAFKAELSLGIRNLKENKTEKAYVHLERAHILGQKYLIPHLKVHLWMLRVGIKTVDLKEVLGQLIRIPSGIVGNIFGKLPVGNTGRSNVGMMSPMEIPSDLLEILDGE